MGRAIGSTSQCMQCLPPRSRTWSLPQQPTHIHRIRRQRRTIDSRALRRRARLSLSRSRRICARTHGNGVTRNPTTRLLIVLFDQLGHHQLCAQQRLFLCWTGKRCQQLSRLSPAHHGCRPHRIGPLFRAVHQPLPNQPA